MTSRLFQTVAARMETIRPSRRQRVWVLGLAAVGFLVGFIVTLSSVSIAWSRLAWPALGLLLLVAVPAMTVSNALEYTMAASLAGRSVRFLDALRIAVLSTAANLLPLPGGPLVRMKGLVDEGLKGRSAVGVTVLMALAWLSVSLTVAGLFGGLVLGAAVAATMLGAAGLLVVGVVISRNVREGARMRSTIGVIIVELAATLVTAARLWLAATALDLSIGGGAFVLGVAPVLGAMVFIVPAGLGIREAIAALAAPAVGLSPAEGFLISSLDRLAGLLVHGVAAIALTAIMRRDGVSEVR